LLFTRRMRARLNPRRGLSTGRLGVADEGEVLLARATGVRDVDSGNCETRAHPALFESLWSYFF
jgi:hypothetical protein